MDKIKLGIIGMGNMGRGHAKNLIEGKCPEIDWVAAADINPERIEAAKADRSDKVVYFDDAIKMLDSGLIDSCLICVPHYDHAKYAIECMKRSIHVMCEKPAGVYTLQVREMNKVADEHPEVSFGMMFNQRTNHVYRKVRELVQSGEYGQIRRVNWIITNWYRSQAYYDSGDWRATWSGEGGGVLLNQCPHQLDLWQWICGMPVKVLTKMHFGKWHDIEVEDDVSTYVEYANGATGVFITSTGEFPGTNRLEISGTLGKIVVENGVLKWWKLPESERDICFNAKDLFPSIKCEYEEYVTQNSNVSAHKLIIQNYVNAILYDEELLSPGTDGIYELSLSNAAYLSSWKGGEAIKLPLKTEEFDKLLNEKIKNSKTNDPTATKHASGKYSKRWQVNW